MLGAQAEVVQPVAVQVAQRERLYPEIAQAAAHHRAIGDPDLTQGSPGHDRPGLRGVAHPSELFLSERPRNAPGSAVLPAVEGSRPILVEVQALVGEPAQGNPRRNTIGVDAHRVALILAVLQRRLGLELAQRDVFVNVTGGLVVTEPAGDLAVAAAIVSSLRRRAIPERWAMIGEIGLTGEIRSVSRLETRLREAGRLGFTSALVPSSGTRIEEHTGVELTPVRNVADALYLFFGDEDRG